MPNLTVVFTMTDDPSWDGETRRIDPTMLRDHLTDELDSYEFLVAGPPAMAEAVAESLQGAGVPEEQVRADRFSGY
jgi:NAD(P)H-flavin reductase